jgi:UMF1 family MFS transporter
MARRPAWTQSLLARVGLDRPDLRAWAMYDWATSPAQTTILVAVFPIFFGRVAGAGYAQAETDQYWNLANSVARFLIAICAPVLGAIADYAAAKKKLLAVFLALGSAAAAAMFFIAHGDLVFAAVLLILVTIGATGSFVFYESMLPHLATGAAMDRLSTAGYALGYVGGGTLLALNLAWILNPGLVGLPAGEGLSPADQTLPTRLAFLSVAVWWIVFSIPLFRRVPEPPLTRERDELDRRRGVLAAAFIRLGETLRALRGYRQAFVFLIAYLTFSDGIGTIQANAAKYGESLGIGASDLIAAIVVVQFVGIPCSLLFGLLAGWMGTKRALFVGIGVFMIVSVLGYFMQDAGDFWTVALLVGLVQGGTQALSRSLFASMIPRHKSAEFFGFFSIFSKFAGVFGPLLYAYVIAQTGSMRGAILSTILLFIIGGAVLLFVDVEQGVAAARRADDDAVAARS